MVRITSNTIKKPEVLLKTSIGYDRPFKSDAVSVPNSAKAVAWAIFLILFIESDTLGLFPKQFYMVFRNVRISDLILYGLIVYSLSNTREYAKLFRSKLLLIVKFMLGYMVFEFIVSVISYSQNPVEYFFRLKGAWFSFMVFPFLLLIKRGGFNYLIKLILPVAIISNILYILTATTGVSFLPGAQIVSQNLPGGLKVYRVFGGTFYGEFFFLGFIYKWLTDKFRLYQLPLVVLFVLPHILAFGRSAWVGLVYTILCMYLYTFLSKKEFKVLFRQGVLLVLLGIAVTYSFMKFIPESSYLVEAVESRVTQGEEDYKYQEGTYGTRIASTAKLIELWQNSNILIGIGMHPMWVIKPMTEEENLYAWGFSDVKWASVLAAYGILGFSLAIVYQIFYFIVSLKILKHNKNIDIFIFFIILMASGMFFESTVYFATGMFTFGLDGLALGTTFSLAILTYKYEEMKKGLKNN